ncbi:uncharacterized protein KY384_007887 [Bacidia gigantensis]|uniref:uncharacterized protein n=1 Tax=Bacidia gigantensis TaxID=2732470 RepID=UPI001D04B713|nr:uncharacterized protein KY384_007887 [Bacidia gigantensis]KAG8527733.1 hypothetical protein KY384_007887 [Bacidia gigantensis]
MIGRESTFSGGTSFYPSTMSITSSGRRSKNSRLRNEVIRSPEDAFVDLFPRTRIRLANMAYEPAQPIDQENMTTDELRRRMLSIVFGWEDDIEPLIRDELSFHQPGSTSAVLLSKWLGEVDSDMMASAIASGNVSSSDWMVLALSQMGGSNPMGKMGQAFVQRLLQQGDFHTSATILLGLGDREDAVEVYVERCFFMEAILLTCLIFPLDWQRQAHLVRRWGEFVVENSQQQLAIRCFTCTGVEPPIPWGSPSPRVLDSSSQAPSTISSMLSPPSSPPLDRRPTQRMTAKNSSLKVITSFENTKNQAQWRFGGAEPLSIDRTPTMAPGITPIAESAISEGATPGGFMSRRAATPGGYRQRLPSIGETPVDVNVPAFPRPSKLPTPDNSGSDFERERERLTKSQPAQAQRQQSQVEDLPPLLSSARYTPVSTPINKTPSTAIPQTSIRTTVLPNPAQDAFTAFQEKQSRSRQHSKDRKPEGLHIRMPSQEQIQTTSFVSKGDIVMGSSELKTSNTLSSAYSGGLRTGRSDTSASAKSPSLSGASYGASAKSPSVSGRSIDEYIRSVDAASNHSRRYKHKKRQESREGRSERKALDGHRQSEQSEDRGRDGRKYVRPAKRSPSSPVPMSPDHYQYEAEGLPSDAITTSSESKTARDAFGGRQVSQKYRSGSKVSELSERTIRNRSPSGQLDSQYASTTHSRVSSRQQSPRGRLESKRRGRSQSKNRAGSAAGSPPSPLPLSPRTGTYHSSDDETDPFRIVAANRERIRSRHRSGSRRPSDRGVSRASTDRRRRHTEARSARASEIDEPRSAVEPRRNSDQLVKQTEAAGRGFTAQEVRRKELAARELEARRESLLRNPEAPPILRPEDVSRPSPFGRAQTDLTNSPSSYQRSATSDRFPPNSANSVYSDRGSRAGAATVAPSYGLPATPRAMRHPRYDSKDTDSIPAVPEIPGDVQNIPELYYAGGPMRDIPRSMSAPIPEQPRLPMPEHLPNHPAFHRGLNPERRPSQFQPLGSIGQHRRKGSSDANAAKHPPVTAGIDETLYADSHPYRASELAPPPLLPELQHLNMQAPPPPPPPPPAPRDPENSSLSSNSNVGAINIVLDDEPGDEANVVEVPPAPPAVTARSPPPHSTRSPPPSDGGAGSQHKRGRSENFKSGFKGITGRLRSNSRGRNAKGTEQLQQQPTPNGPSSYESVPPLYF